MAHLDHEYAELCRVLVARLGRKRPSPLARGDVRIWASGANYTVGRVNSCSLRGAGVPLRLDGAEMDELLDLTNHHPAPAPAIEQRPRRSYLGDVDWEPRRVIEASHDDGLWRRRRVRHRVDPDASEQDR